MKGGILVSWVYEWDVYGVILLRIKVKILFEFG